jgi:hypothetical protein
VDDVEYADRFATAFKHAVELKLVLSAGAVESVASLRDPKSGISIALVPGGITSEQESPDWSLLALCSTSL